MKKLALTLFVSLCMLSAHVKAMDEDWQIPTPAVLQKQLYLRSSMKPEDMPPIAVTPNWCRTKKVVFWNVKSLALTESDKKHMEKWSSQYPDLQLHSHGGDSLLYQLFYKKKPAEDSVPHAFVIYSSSDPTFLDSSFIELTRSYENQGVFFPSDAQVELALRPFFALPTKQDIYPIATCCKIGSRKTTFLWEIRQVDWKDTAGKVPEMIESVKFDKIENGGLYYNIFFTPEDADNNTNASHIVLQRNIDQENNLKRERYVQAGPHLTEEK